MNINTFQIPNSDSKVYWKNIKFIKPPSFLKNVYWTTHIY